MLTSFLSLDGTTLTSQALSSEARLISLSLGFGHFRSCSVGVYVEDDLSLRFCNEHDGPPHMPFPEPARQFYLNESSEHRAAAFIW